MAKPKAKKYLVWDFDGTLAYRTGGWSGALISVLKQVNPKSKVTIDEIRPYLQTGFPWHAPENAHPGLSTDDWWEDLKPVFMRAFRSTGVPGSKALELAGQVRSVYTDPAGWVRYDDSLPALEALSQQGWTHLLLTNHVPELLSLLDKLDLVRPFAKIFNSFNTGYEKPNPKAFRTVTDWTGANAIQWIIGDSYHSDVLGAQEFGLPALLVRVKPAEARKMGAKFYCAAVAETPRFFEDK